MSVLQPRSAYIPKWVPLAAAIEHVQLVAGGAFTVAWNALLLPALCDGAVKSRYRGRPLGGIPGMIEGWGGEIAPESWYQATVYPDGKVEFGNEPGRAFGLRRLRHEIEVSNEDLLRVWPHPKPADKAQPGSIGEPPTARADEADIAAMRTGAPGRPSKGMHLIRMEFERRLGETACKRMLREEATELRQWFYSTYPNAQPPTIKTIENNLRSDYRKHVAASD